MVQKGVLSMPNANSPNSPRRVRATQRQLEAIQYRIAGLSYEAIGKRLGISGVSVAKLIKRALQTYYSRIGEEIEVLRRIELERLDVAQSAIWNGVVNGDLEAIDKFLRISARRSALLGLDSPQKQEMRNKIEIEAFDYASAIAAITTRPVEDSNTSSQDEDFGDGSSLG